jgi:microcystin-dependent protein
LPDLRGRIPIHQGTGPGLSQYTIGQLGGVETVTLTAVQLGGHTHAIQANNKSGSSASPGGNIVAGTAVNPYSTGTGDVNMGAATIGAAGGSQPHSNMMPFLAVSFVISLFGIFPSQN